MQNYSKTAHFQLGGQAGNKISTQKNTFTQMNPAETYRDKILHLKGNVQNMRANHFDIGMAKKEPT